MLIHLYFLLEIIPSSAGSFISITFISYGRVALSAELRFCDSGVIELIMSFYDAVSGFKNSTSRKPVINVETVDHMQLLLNDKEIQEMQEELVSCGIISSDEFLEMWGFNISASISFK